MDGQQNLVLIIVLYHFFTLLMVAGTLLIIWRYCRKNRQNRKELLLSVALAAVLFHITLKDALILPVFRIFNNLEKLFLFWVDCNTWKLRDPQLTGITIHSFDKIINPVSDILLNFPLGKLICAVSFAILLYYSLLSLKKPGNILSSQTNGDKRCLWYNLAISATLAFSLFLVISVFITIPYFSEIRKPTDYTKQRLDEVVSKWSTRDTLQVSIPPGPFIETMVNSVVLDSATSQFYRGLSMKHRKEADECIAQLQTENNKFNSQRIAAIERMKKYAKNYPSKEETFRQRLLSQFENATLSLVTDKANMYQLCVSTFEQFVQSEKEYYQQMQSSMDSIDAMNRYAIKRCITIIRQSISSISQSPNNGDRIVLLLSNDSFKDYAAIGADRAYKTTLPAYTKDGSDWGLFGFMARYLIRTQSMELALLIGMFGFGILGASIFSFEKKDATRHFVASFTTQPLIRNFGSVLARGLGAALIVYLATKGGLAIFTLGATSDPNGYILLLSCFVGAVFSEKVWDKISSFFHKSTGPKDTVSSTDKEG